MAHASHHAATEASDHAKWAQVAVLGRDVGVEVVEGAHLALAVLVAEQLHAPHAARPPPTVTRLAAHSQHALTPAAHIPFDTRVTGCAQS